MQAKRQKSRPNTREQLQLCIKKEMRRNGHNCDLNHIDVSRIDNMDRLFLNSPFNGDISRWDVGHVVWMNEMFQESQFNGDISRWNVSRVVGMRQMFAKSNFNGDVASWDVSSCRNFNKMFYGAPFLGDVSSWTMGVDADILSMFSTKQLAVHQHPSIFHWCIADIGNMPLSPKMQDFHAQHAAVVEGFGGNVYDRARLMHSMWLQNRAQPTVEPFSLPDLECPA